MTDKPNAPSPETIESYHQRNCKICRHPDRPAIEFDFVHWRSPQYIAKEYNFSWRSLYRHAHAAGLFRERRRNLRSNLEIYLEGVGEVPLTPDGLVRAIQLYARIREDGELIEQPKKQVIVVTRDALAVTNPTVGVGATISIEASPNSEGPPTFPPRYPDQESITSQVLQPDNPCQTEISLSH